MNLDVLANQGLVVPNEVFYDVLIFLDPKELASAERVCKSWKEFIETSDLWKRQCQGLNIIDAKIYWKYLRVKIGDVPPLPAKSALIQSFRKDPEDPTKTIGQTHTCFCNPPEFELESEKGRVVIIANTLNNIEKLFCHPKQRFVDKNNFIEENIAEQYGNKQVVAEWIWMRNDMIGKGLSFDEQQARVKEKGFIIPSLLERVNFNFLKHMITGKYPDDSQDDSSMIYARTSTIVQRVVAGSNWYTACGASNIYDSDFDVTLYDQHADEIGWYSEINICFGVAVTLPLKKV